MPFLPLNWALMEFETALHPTSLQHAELTSCERFRVIDLLAQSRELLFEFRGHCGQITNWLKQPVPFQYYHGLAFVLMCQMLIISWGLISIEMHSVLTVWVYVSLCLGFFGLKEVGATPRHAIAAPPAPTCCRVAVAALPAVRVRCASHWLRPPPTHPPHLSKRNLTGGRCDVLPVW